MCYIYATVQVYTCARAPAGFARRSTLCAVRHWDGLINEAHSRQKSLRKYCKFDVTVGVYITSPTQCQDLIDLTEAYVITILFIVCSLRGASKCDPAAFRSELMPAL